MGATNITPENISYPTLQHTLSLAREPRRNFQDHA